MPTPAAHAVINNTTDGVTFTSGSFTVPAGNLPYVWIGCSGSTSSDWAVTDSLGSPWVKQSTTRILKAASVDFLELWICDVFATGAARTLTFSHASGTATGCIAAIESMPGMLKTGASALLQVGTQNNQSSTTPTVALPVAAQAANPTLVAFFVTNTVNTTTYAGWTLLTNTNYATPSTQLRTFYAASSSGQTATGNASVGVTYADAIVELDASPYAMLLMPTFQGAN